MKSDSRRKGEDMQEALPAFQRIQDYPLGEIQAGCRKKSEAIPSEPALAKQFGVSRMTVNRAVRELTAEQICGRNGAESRARRLLREA